jgi:hypothetical protein
MVKTIAHKKKVRTRRDWGPLYINDLFKFGYANLSSVSAYSL